VAQLLLDILARGSTNWAWSATVWIDVLGKDQRAFLAVKRKWARSDHRQHMIALAYLLRGFTDLRALGHFERERLAIKVFGSERVVAAIAPVEEVLAAWGYADHGAGRGIRRVVCEALLANGSPRLSDLTVETLAGLRQTATPAASATLHQVHRAFAALGIMAPPELAAPPEPPTEGVDPLWSEWVLTSSGMIGHNTANE